MRQETDIMGNTSVTCLTDKGGWSVNPMTGSTTAADMPAEVFNAMKSQLVIGAPFIQYQANGIKADLDGTEVIGDVKAIKIKLTEADNSTSTYFFDPNTFSMIRSVKKMQMRGQEAEIAVDFSNFNKAGDFYVIPFKSEMAMGNGMKMVNTVTKAEIDKAVDMAIFNKP
jgi:ABC-type sulfate/molybdate transport systems ATPase subunit